MPADTLSLTFDDGPDLTWSPRILDELHRCKASGTFFMVGERVREAPGLVASVIDAGNEVQLHCDRHIRHTELSELQIERDTRQALATLACVGVQPTWWRTPWGVRTAATARVARRNRLRLVNWTIDTHDWRGDEATTMLARARAQLAGGAIVLMHDALGPGALRDGPQNTVDLLMGLVATARSRGLRVGTLARAAGRGA